MARKRCCFSNENSTQVDLKMSNEIFKSFTVRILKKDSETLIAKSSINLGQKSALFFKQAHMGLICYPDMVNDKIKCKLTSPANFKSLIEKTLLKLHLRKSRFVRNNLFLSQTYNTGLCFC